MSQYNYGLLSLLAALVLLVIVLFVAGRGKRFYCFNFFLALLTLVLGSFAFLSSVYGVSAFPHFSLNDYLSGGKVIPDGAFWFMESERAAGSVINAISFKGVVIIVGCLVMSSIFSTMLCSLFESKNVNSGVLLLMAAFGFALGLSSIWVPKSKVFNFNAYAVMYSSSATIDDEFIGVLKMLCNEHQSAIIFNEFTDDGEYDYTHLGCGASPEIMNVRSGRGLSFFDDDSSDSLDREYFRYGDLDALLPSVQSADLLFVWSKTDNSYQTVLRFEADKAPPIGSIDQVNIDAQKIVDTFSSSFRHKRKSDYQRLSLISTSEFDEWEELE
ncbi:hypothetical protein QTV49_004265 [Vibrio vulnificus]|nr:hypothetical protein [Vibrio vulnificus]